MRSTHGLTLAGKPPETIEYPESDGQPIAENTLQFRWIVTIEGGIDALCADDDNVFVAGDLLWYPVEGDPTIRQAPDVMVAFGRPKGDRGSYMQWKENGVAPQVVFEILSPGNRLNEMSRKFQFYERYGVQEYYIYDPDRGELFGWLRSGDRLLEVPSMQGWASPLLKIRFELVDGELNLSGPNGRRFATFLELVEQRNQAEREKEQAQRDKEQAQRDKEQAQRDKEQAQRGQEQALRDVQQQAEMMERLRAQLNALGVKPEI
jgi:Uma2 family endonuclease